MNHTAPFFALALSVVSLAVNYPSLAQADEPPKAARLLFVTQSKGFVHDVVKRKDGKLALAEQAMTEVGVASNLFRVDCTQDVAKDFTTENLKSYDIVMFYTTGDLPIA